MINDRLVSLNSGWKAHGVWKKVVKVSTVLSAKLSVKNNVQGPLCSKRDYVSLRPALEWHLHLWCIAREPTHQLQCWQGINHGPRIINGAISIQMFGKNSYCCCFMLSPSMGMCDASKQVWKHCQQILFRYFSAFVCKNFRTLPGLVGYQVPYRKNVGKHMIAR